MKLKNETTKKKGLSVLEAEKLKGTLKHAKMLHKEQLQLKEARIVDQNATIKSIKAKNRQLEKTLTSLENKFAAFQRKAASDISKLERKRELFEVKEQNKREKESKRREEKDCEKEIQKRRLQDAIRMHHHITPQISTKKYQESIINNFRTSSSYVPLPGGAIDWTQLQMSQDSGMNYGGPNISNHTGLKYLGLEAAMPNFDSLLDTDLLSDKKRAKKKAN